MNIALIPAKGFSRRIPRKNIRHFHGKPIIAYPIQTAQMSGLFSSVIVSTDDEEIAEIAQRHGADILMRGERLCAEEIGPLDVLRHSLGLISDVNFACCIYATAPLLTVNDLIIGWRAVQREGIAYACSVGAEPFLHDAASFMWCRAWALKENMPWFGDNTVMIPIPQERDIDINEEGDWVKAEQMFAALQQKAAA